MYLAVGNPNKIVLERLLILVTVNISLLFLHCIFQPVVGQHSTVHFRSSQVTTIIAMENATF